MAGASLPETGPEPRRSGPPPALQGTCISSNYSSSERELINRVFRLFETVTCLRLVPRTSEKDYVRITPTGRCSGEVGRRGGRQKISLPHWCLSFGHAAHELMHTAGFWHEHQRPDRDQFVRVLWDNIKPRHRRTDYGRRVWEELGEGSWLGPYDYRSILHYSGRGSAVDSTKPTMVARQGGVKLGGNGNLTDIDIWKINTQYHCWQRRVANSLYEFGDNQLGGRQGRRFGRTCGEGGKHEK
ncbi:Zinc metalloproteinase nas-8 [Amphibalanus amphitrite]|uniref:Metalloendopeptidase n=1 Tax=Amphibalanus amphitrite TaxID=1232801 RepID=A0A6A4VA52_AMPAM|nr:Zinc metalloproteinase nas-8 [Amphibalanus amphitrite]